jgi:hypothetical protein
MTYAHDPHIASRRAKKAKMSVASLVPSPNNEEVRHLTNAGAVPDWFPEIQDVWRAAMNHVSHLNLASQTSSIALRFHLFISSGVVSLRANVSTSIITSCSSTKSRIGPSATSRPSPPKNGGLF